MGLARQALEALCHEGYKSIAPDAPGTAEQQRRFRDLLSSVLREAGQVDKAMDAESEK